MLNDKIAAPLLPVISIYADRSLSASTARFVHGIVPVVRTLLTQGRDRTEAFISRETLAAATGLHPSDVIEYARRQEREAGAVVMTSVGEFSTEHHEESRTGRKACGYALGEYEPQDLPQIAVPVRPYVIDIDHEAIADAISPVSDYWLKEVRAHRLVMALLHHGGLNSWGLTPALAGEILGRSALTGRRALADLERMGLCSKEGRTFWVDVSSLFYDSSLNREHPEVAERLRDAEALKASSASPRGWEVRNLARTAREVVARLRGLPKELNEDYAGPVGASLRQAILWHLRELRRDPDALGCSPGF